MNSSADWNSAMSDKVPRMIAIIPMIIGSGPFPMSRFCFSMKVSPKFMRYRIPKPLIARNRKLLNFSDGLISPDLYNNSAVKNSPIVAISACSTKFHPNCGSPVLAPITCEPIV